MPYAAILFAVASLSSYALTVCQADDLADFLGRYPKSVGTIILRYSSLSLKGDQDRFDGQGQVTMSQKVNLLLKGDRFRFEGTCVRSADSTWPVGSLQVAGGDPQLLFEAKRAPHANKFVFVGYGKSSAFSSKLRYSFANAAFAPYCVTDELVPEILADPKFKPVSAKSVSTEGQSAIEVTLRCVDGNIRTKSVLLTFEAKSLCLMSYNVVFENFKLVGKNEYNFAAAIPEILTVERWIEKANGRDNASYVKTTVDSINFGPVPDEQLTPAAAGLTDLPFPTTDDGRGTD